VYISAARSSKARIRAICPADRASALLVVSGTGSVAQLAGRLSDVAGVLAVYAGDPDEDERRY
jgi:hypothetical protein